MRLRIARQFVVYSLVGGVSALIDVGLMQLLISCGVYYLTATTVGFLLGLLVNFLLHARVTFKKDYYCAMFARYVIVVLANYIFTIAIVELFHRTLSLPVLGKIVSLPLVAVIGFFLSKYWIFKAKQPKKISNS